MCVILGWGVICVQILLLVKIEVTSIKLGRNYSDEERR